MENQIVERIRKGEEDVEVRNVENFLAAFLEPVRTGFGAAPGTVTITTGVPEDVLVVAAVAVIKMTTQSVGTAVGDRTQHLALRW